MKAAMEKMLFDAMQKVNEQFQDACERRSEFEIIGYSEALTNIARAITRIDQVSLYAGLRLEDEDRA